MRLVACLWYDASSQVFPATYDVATRQPMFIRWIPLVLGLSVFFGALLLEGRAAGQAGAQPVGAEPVTTSASASAADAAWTAPVSSPRLDLVTMGAGEDLFVRVGHAVICIVPSGKTWNQGTCYNWGQTDFSNTALVIQRYLLGGSIFWATSNTYARVFQYYAQQVDRTFYVQTLPAPADAIRKLDQALRLEVMPRFREYPYHHLKANCASKVRDRLDEALGGALKQGSEDVPMPPTWRDWARTYLAGDPLMMTAAELSGPALDVVPSEWEAMALPDVLREVVERKLKVPPQVLHSRSTALPSGSMYGGKLALGLLGLLLAGLAALSGSQRMPERARKARGVLLVGLGLLGVLSWGLIAISALDETRANVLPLLWMPLDLSVFWLSARWQQRYLMLRLGVVGCVMVAGVVGVLTQPTLFPGLLVALPLLVLLWGQRRDSHES